MKNPPSAYLEKLKSFVDHGGVSRKVYRSKRKSNILISSFCLFSKSKHELLEKASLILDLLIKFLSFLRQEIERHHKYSTVRNICGLKLALSVQAELLCVL